MRALLALSCLLALSLTAGSAAARPAQICIAVAQGLIAPTDTILFEDAGPRCESAAAEQSWLEHVVPAQPARAAAAP